MTSHVQFRDSRRSGEKSWRDSKLKLNKLGPALRIADTDPPPLERKQLEGNASGADAESGA
jgi:hypothetical protein